jgi:hypothetical protein
MTRPCPECQQPIEPVEVTGDLYWICTDCCWFDSRPVADEAIAC